MACPVERDSAWRSAANQETLDSRSGGLEHIDLSPRIGSARPVAGKRPASSARRPPTDRRLTLGQAHPDSCFLGNRDAFELDEVRAGRADRGEGGPARPRPRFLPPSLRAGPPASRCPAFRRIRRARWRDAAAPAACRAARPPASAGRRHGERPDRRRISRAEPEEIEGVHHADHLVQGPPVDRQTGVAAARRRREPLSTDASSGRAMRSVRGVITLRTVRCES